MRKKLLMLALVLTTTAASSFITPRKAGALCNPICCGGDSCSCCSGSCRCPAPVKNSFF
jgi:hypothetical protein